MSRTRTLIVTLPPMRIGGVSSKVRILADELLRRGHDVTVAYYDLPGRTDDPRLAFGEVASVAVPCGRPWLEQRYTAGSPAWQNLVDTHDRHVALGGTVLIANPLAEAKRRHMIWCAADLAGDRSHRQDAMPPWRRIADRMLVAPALRRQQDAVLRADNRIFGVSFDTVRRLRSIARDRADTIQRLPIPVDDAFFTLDAASRRPNRIGFAGRLDDPRKNAPLLFAALGQLRRQGADVSLTATGTGTAELDALARRFEIADAVHFTGVLAREGLRDFYRSLDVFVIPSLQEGLAIAGVEAMACGVPVVSTRCGGPEDFVRDGETGRLCAFDAAEMAAAIRDVLSPDRRAAVSVAARRTVEETFAIRRFPSNLDDAWRATWNESP